MKQSRLFGAVCACVIALVSQAAQAVPVSGQGTWETTLQGRDLDGNAATFEAYYDTTLDITWLADAGVFASTWGGANAWAVGLDVNGVTGWRLPTNAPLNGSGYNLTLSTDGTTDRGYATTTTDGTDGGWRDGSGNPVSEMGHMYYVTLGNLGFCDPTLPWCTSQPGWGLSNTGPFSNVVSHGYWSGTRVSSVQAWFFLFNDGFQLFGLGNDAFNHRFAWAVRSGDVGAIPVPDLFGDTLKTSQSFEFSVERYAQTTKTIYLFNPGDVVQSASLKIINPHPQLIVSFQGQIPVTVESGATEMLPLEIDATSEELTAGVYEGILLEVAIDNGSTVYSNITVHVTEEADVLPDLSISSADIGATSATPGEPVTLTANVRNRGTASAANVEVAFYEFDTFLGSTVIDEVIAAGTGDASVTVPAMSSGDHLIRVVIDPSEQIPELDERNNEASHIIQLGDTPDPTAGNILVTGSLPPTVYTNGLFTLTGRAVYDVTVDGVRYTNYVVKGGSVQVTIKSDDGTQWQYGDIHTDVNGNFSRSLVAPALPGTYRIILTVTDTTFSGRRELVFSAVERPATPQPPPSPPCVDCSGTWSYDAVSGEWTWTWTVPGPVPQSDVRVFSENIHFSQNHPAAGEEITVFAEIQYWASSTALVAEDIPVNLYVTYPGTAKEKIGETVIPSLSVGAPTFGTQFVYATWRNASDGIYIVEAEVDPSYQEENTLNNAATRAIVVGDLGSNLGAIAGQVTNPWGGVGNVIMSAYDSSGELFASTVTDSTGFYLIQDVPPGTLEVRIEAPTGFEPDAEAKPAEVVEQAVTVVNFELTEAPVLSLPCDVDQNGTVDINDIRAIAAARNTPAAPGDARDVDGDGMITLNDSRQCVLKCSKPRCAP